MGSSETNPSLFAALDKMNMNMLFHLSENKYIEFYQTVMT